MSPIAARDRHELGVPPINPNFDPGVVNCYIGEYIGVAGDASNFYYLWGDNRTTITTTAFPNGRLDPDVFFEREVAPSANRPPVLLDGDGEPEHLWPPDHRLRLVTLSGATDPDNDPLTLRITGVTQDEPLNGLGDGNTSPDAQVGPRSDQVLLRAERSGAGRRRPRLPDQLRGDRRPRRQLHRARRGRRPPRPGEGPGPEGLGAYHQLVRMTRLTAVGAVLASGALLAAGGPASGGPGRAGARPARPRTSAWLTRTPATR